MNTNSFTPDEGSPQELESTASRSPDDTGGAQTIKELALLARELKAARTAREAYRAALNRLAQLLPADFLSVTASAENSGNNRQRLCATLARGGEFANVDDDAAMRVQHTMLERTLHAGAPVFFNDVPTELVSDALLIPLVCPAPQSVLCAQVATNDDVIGFIIVSASHKQAYTPIDCDRVETVAYLLAATLERIELSGQATNPGERDAARAREQIIAEHLHATNGVGADLNAIMQRASDVLAHALPATSFVLLRTVSFNHPESILRAWLPHSTRPPLEIPAPVGHIERIIYTEQRPVLLEDLRGERAGNVEAATLRPLIERLDARSICFAPIIYNGQMLAALGLVESGANQNYRWTNEDRVLLARAAELLAPLITNAQLQHSLSTYTEDMLALLRLAGDVHDEVELDRTLRATLDSWLRIAGAEAAAILRWHEEDKLLRLAAAKHLPTGVLERYTQGVALVDSLYGLAAHKRAGVVVDLANDARFADLYNAVRWSNLHGAWATPVTAGTGKLLGMIVTFSQFAVEVKASEQRLADLFTRPIAIALQSMELNQQTHAAAQTIKRMEEEVQHAAQHKTEFMAVISHELRTPLNAIIGFAEMLRQGFSGELNAQQQTDVQTISESADKLLGMVEDTLDLARIDDERFPVFMDTVAFEDVVRRAVASVHAAAEAKGIDIQLEVAADAPVIRTDPERVRQILTRLLSNAVKFTERGSVRVTVSASERGHVQVNVSDTGIGFDIKAFPQAFDEFHQADASNTRVHGGAGLGLAVSKRLVQRLGGHIGVTSHPGEGSTFWFQLPPEIPGTDV